MPSFPRNGVTCNSCHECERFCLIQGLKLPPYCFGQAQLRGDGVTLAFEQSVPVDYLVATPCNRRNQFFMRLSEAFMCQIREMPRNIGTWKGLWIDQWLVRAFLTWAALSFSRMQFAVAPLRSLTTGTGR